MNTKFPQPHDRMLFQGDSITNAFRKPDEVGTSYQLGAGWAMMIAAQLQAEHPDWQLQFHNRGVSGNGINNLLQRWDEDCLALKPTVLNLLVGVSETIGYFRGGTNGSVDEFEARYRELLDRSRSALPGLRLILCEPFLLPAGEVTAEWQAHLAKRQAVVRLLAAEYEARFVPLQEPFDQAAERTGPAYWLFDGIHPHAAGQWLIREQWLKQVLQSA